MILFWSVKQMNGFEFGWTYDWDAVSLMDSPIVCGSIKWNEMRGPIVRSHPMPSAFSQHHRRMDTEFKCRNYAQPTMQILHNVSIKYQQFLHRVEGGSKPQYFPSLQSSHGFIIL